MRQLIASGSPASATSVKAVAVYNGTTWIEAAPKPVYVYCATKDKAGKLHTYWQKADYGTVSDMDIDVPPDIANSPAPETSASALSASTITATAHGPPNQLNNR